jgi:hypothetical protein
MAGLQTIVFMFGIIGIMGTWDGLIRRHIRLSFDPLGMFIILRGVPAVLVGLVSAVLLLFVARLEMIEVQDVQASCASLTCILQHTVFDLFASLQSLFVLLLFSFVFVYWLWGAFDLNGPYRRQMLALGVWYEEKEAIRQVRQQLQDHHLPPRSDEHIIRAARTLIINLKAYAKIQGSERLDPKALADIYVHINPPRRRDISRASLQAERIMAQTILQYYLDLHDRAVVKWPWIRRLLGY